MSSLSLRSNIAALKAQRQLDQGNARLASVHERLSSGQRINRASDDAAGLAIATSLKKDARVYTQAIRNGNDAISALAISDGALEQLSGIVIRIKELAIQAANGSLGRLQRLSLDGEGEALTDEFNRLIASTTFNGQKLVDGTLDTIGIQLGYGTNGQIGVGFGSGIRRKLGTGFSSSHATAYNEDATFSDRVTGDFNGDGRTDIAAADSSILNLGVIVYLNNGNGGFTESIQSLGASVTSIAAADINGDGITDLVAGGSANVYKMIGQGNGTFSNSTAFISSAFIGKIEVGDINGDGKIDLAGITGSGSTISFVLGNGNGTFSSVSTTSSTNTATDLRIADLNNDGKDDIVTNDTVGRFIVTRLSNGNGTFASAQTRLSLNQPGELVVSDFNYDGFLDVATIRAGGGTFVAVHLGAGDGTVGTVTQQLTLTGGNANLRGADMDGDGILDLVTYTPGAIKIAKGRGDGSFDDFASHTVTLLGGTGDLVIGDFNGDGINDAGSDGLASNYIEIYYAATTNAATLERVNLTSVAGARSALGTLDSALARIQREMGLVGSSQSRILSALNAINARRDTSESAAGRIMDADIANESAQLIREQILQQAAASVLGQANQAPALALQLLQ